MCLTVILTIQLFLLLNDFYITQDQYILKRLLHYVGISQSNPMIYNVLPAKPSLHPVLTPQSKLQALNDLKTQSTRSCSEREYIPIFCSQKEAIFMIKLKTWVDCSHLQQGTLLTMFLHFCISNFPTQCLEEKSFNFRLTISLMIVFIKFRTVSLSQSGSDKNVILFPLEKYVKDLLQQDTINLYNCLIMN